MKLFGMILMSKANSKGDPVHWEEKFQGEVCLQAGLFFFFEVKRRSWKILETLLDSERTAWRTQIFSLFLFMAKRVVSPDIPEL